MQEMTYSEWMERWFGKHEEVIKNSTAATYAAAVENHILPAFGQLPVAELTESRLQETVLTWLKEGRRDGTGGLSERTVRGMVALVKHSLRAAAKEGYAPPTQFDIVFPPQETVRKLDVFSKEEQALLMQHIYMHLNPRTLGLMFCMHTGLRIGELCALRWEDIDMVNRTVTVCRTLQRIYRRDATGQGHSELKISTPKTRHSVRSLPISSLLMPVLKRMQPEDSTCYLLTGKPKPTEPRTYREFYDRLLQKLEIRHINFHGLRHTFATRLIENGADCKTVSELLGHATVTITLNLYVHPQMEQKRKAVELIW